MNLLSREWAPLGFVEDVPSDEYECVTGPLATLLRSGVPTHEIAALLAKHRTDHLGLDPDLTVDVHAADESIGWYRVAMRHAAARDIPGR